MIELIHTNTLEWKDYSTEFFTEKKLKEFLLSESIPCLSCRFKTPEDFYENIIFKIPSTEGIKKFKMNYINENDLLENKNIISQGFLTMMDTSQKNPPRIKWLLEKL